MFDDSVVFDDSAVFDDFVVFDDSGDVEVSVAISDLFSSGGVDVDSTCDRCSISSFTSRIPFLNSTMLLPTERATSGKRRPKSTRAITRTTIHSQLPGRPKNAGVAICMIDVPAIPSQPLKGDPFDEVLSIDP